MSLEIIQLNPSEWGSMKELRLRALQDTPQAFGTSYNEALARSDDYWRDSLERSGKGVEWWYFAKLDRKLVGMMGGKRETHEKLSHQAEIVGVYVAPEARGLGVGSKIMEAMLEAIGKSDGIRSVGLHVTVGQESAYALYKKFGFVERGRVPDDIRVGDKYYETIDMVKYFVPPSN